MLFQANRSFDATEYRVRREKLIARIREQYQGMDRGAIVVFANFERDAASFRQESSFYYLTGIEEPGAVLFLDFSGKQQLYIPRYKTARSQWVQDAVQASASEAKRYLLDEIQYGGDAAPGYALYPFSDLSSYRHLIQEIDEIMRTNGFVFTLNPKTARDYVEQRLLLSRLYEVVPHLSKGTIDISAIVASMRRSKDVHEIECMYKAVGITHLAQEAAAEAIAVGCNEKEVQARLEFVMTVSGCTPSFPSIVAGGKNGTVLHYQANRDEINRGELVVVDIGASYNYYAADITRTYPAGGMFTERQRELYELVLETQQHVADHAQPGMWLSNADEPEKSLHHIAKQFLADRGGYDRFFVHGIGHFLGIDVHDVGDGQKPLEEGDVITIEPGVYIPEENIGIRIEDNYWIVKSGAVCLSEHIVKNPDAIEDMMQRAAQNKAEEPVDDEQHDDDIDLDMLN